MAELGEKMFLADIPEDIKKISRKKLLIRFFILCAVYAFEIVIAVIFRDMFFKHGVNRAVINSAIFVLVPWLFIIMPLRKDRSWVGKIQKCCVVTKDNSIESYRFVFAEINPCAIKNSNAEDRIVLKLINGFETFSKDISSFTVESEDRLNNYKKNYIAIHILGTKYPTVLPENEDDKTICAVCGEENECSDTHCKDCGHSLLNKNNVKQLPGK